MAAWGGAKLTRRSEVEGVLRGDIQESPILPPSSSATTRKGGSFARHQSGSRGFANSNPIHKSIQVRSYFYMTQNCLYIYVYTHMCTKVDVVLYRHIYVCVCVYGQITGTCVNVSKIYTFACRHARTQLCIYIYTRVCRVRAMKDRRATCKWSSSTRRLSFSSLSISTLPTSLGHKRTHQAAG